MDGIEFPPNGKDVFALTVEGTHLMPVYPDKTVLICSKEEPLVVDARVAIMTKAGKLYAYKYDGEDGPHYVFRPFAKTDVPIYLEKAKTDWIGRIMWASQ